MPRRRGWILVVLGLVLAVGTGALVFFLLQNAAPVADIGGPALPPTPVPTKSLPVAARAMDIGTVISDTDVVVRDFPLDLQVTGIVTDASSLIGQTLVEPVVEGEFIRTAQIQGGEGAPLSADIEQGQVVIAYPAGDLLSQSRVLREGDRVDLLLTIDLTDTTGAETLTGKSTNITLQNVNVLRIVREAATDDNPNPPPTAILFQLEPRDAVIAKFVKDYGGVIDFALRSKLDTDEFTVENAYNLDNLRDDYRFSAPRSNAVPTQQ